MGSETNKSETQVDWAPQSWFAAQLSENDGAAYFGHSHNGYQRFRHFRLITELDRLGDVLICNNLLDLGCATGVLTDKIRRHFFFSRAVGIDFVQEVLERGRQLYPDIEFYEGALPILPFVDEKFDLVVASEVLYYLTPEAQQQAITAIDNLLHNGGFLLVGAVLGGDYFSSGNIKVLLEPNFEIVSVSKLHMNYYHKLVSPFYYATRLDNLLRSGAKPGSEVMKKRFERFHPALSFPPIRALVRILAYVGRPILASVRFPDIVNKLSHWGKPSNIAIIARKR